LTAAAAFCTRVAGHIITYLIEHYAKHRTLLYVLS